MAALLLALAPKSVGHAVLILESERGEARRRLKGPYQTGPGSAGTDSGVAGAESTARAASVLPSRANQQLRSCAGGRGAVMTRPTGAESNPKTGTDC